MKNKLSLVPKIKLTLSVSNRLLLASMGVGSCIVLFTAAYLYFTLGNNNVALAANSNHTSKDNNHGLWKSESTWLKREAWMANMPQNGSYYTAEVLGIVTYESIDNNDVFTVSNGATLDVTDTLVIKGEALFSGGANINVSTTGVLVVFGDLSLTGGSRLTNQGRIVVTENLKTTGGARITNNPSSNNGFYTYGTRTQSEGGSYGTSQKNEAQLEINDPSLYNFVSNGGIITLPIVLNHFIAKITPSKSVMIEWSTVSEKENDFFTLERSSDGKTFEVIATIKGAGNSLQKLQYSVEDTNSPAGMNYYRLKQTDFNGDFEYFKIIGINNTSSEAGIKNIGTLKINEAYPNPFNEIIKISFEAESFGEAEVAIQNSKGEFLHREHISFYNGRNEYKYTGSDLQPGIYYITLFSHGLQFKPQRLIKI